MSESKTRMKLVHKLIVPAAAIASLCGLVGCELESIKSDGDAHSTDVNVEKLISCCNMCKSQGYYCKFTKYYCTCEEGDKCNIHGVCPPYKRCQKDPFKLIYHCVPNF